LLNNQLQSNQPNPLNTPPSFINQHNIPNVFPQSQFPQLNSTMLPLLNPQLTQQNALLLSLLNNQLQSNQPNPLNPPPSFINQQMPHQNMMFPNNSITTNPQNETGEKKRTKPQDPRIANKKSRPDS